MVSETTRKNSKIAVSGDPERRTVIGRHHHHHGGARLLRLAAARRADGRGEMRRRDDYRNTSGDMLEHRVHHGLALGIRQHELFGEIGEDADALRARIDHEIDAAALTVEVEVAAIVENGRRDGKDAAIGSLGGHGQNPRFHWRQARHHSPIRDTNQPPRQVP